MQWELLTFRAEFLVLALALNTANVFKGTVLTTQNEAW
jgi:hypothetical protein